MICLLALAQLALQLAVVPTDHCPTCCSTSFVPSGLKVGSEQMKPAGSVQRIQNHNDLLTLNHLEVLVKPAADKSSLGF